MNKFKVGSCVTSDYNFDIRGAVAIILFKEKNNWWFLTTFNSQLDNTYNCYFLREQDMELYEA